MTIHFLMRRSKAEGSQEHSLDVQRAGCTAFASARQLGGKPVEHVSDGVAGDDVEGLTALRHLLDEVKPGDVVICRDHSRLGRDMLESAVSIRTLVEDRKAQLFYYSSGEHVQWRNATDAVMSVLRGFGAQMELENIRSRVTEGLRSRVRGGFIAGGACYGYRNERRQSASGGVTAAVIDADQAAIIERIFSEYVAGAGITLIAKRLNDEHVPPPSAGTKRGTKSWAPSAIREILRRDRYVGVYVHGRTKVERKGGRRIYRKGDPAQILRIEVPEWRIVDDVTWRRAQALIDQRAAAYAAQDTPTPPGARGKHALTGIARCAHCGGSLTIGRTSLPGRRTVPAYVCSYHHKRGTAVCPVAVAQPQEEVEELLAAHVLRETLAPVVMAEVARQVRVEAEAAFPAERGAVEELERDLEQLRGEQKRLARAVALADDVDELAAELRERSRRIRALEERVIIARREPAQRLALAAELERRALAWMDRIREALAASPADAREAYKALFPSGLRFSPAEQLKGGRRVWVAEGVPELGCSNYVSDPRGSDAKLGSALPRLCVTLRRAA